MKTLLTSGLCLLLFLTFQAYGFAEGTCVTHPMTAGVKYTDGDHCFNCGMDLNMWARTRYQFTSGGEQYEVCSLRCLADINEKNGTKPEKTMTALYLEPEKSVPAESAWYVIGSPAAGTMTMKSKISFAEKEAAEAFVKANGGEVVPFVQALEMATKELSMSRPKINATRLQKGKIQVPADDAQCANCGMYPARFPAFRSQAKNEKGDLIHFCSTKCLVKYKMQNPGMKAPWVTVFPQGDMDFAEALWYVTGSEQMGPMGPEPLPFRSRKEADSFAHEKGGKVVSFQELFQQDMGGHQMQGHQHH